MAKGLGIAGLVFTSLAIASSAVSQYLPNWREIDTPVADTSGNHGIWRHHVGTAEGDWIDEVADNKKLNVHIIRYLMVGGGAFLLLSFILVLVFVCGEGKRGPAVAAAVFNLLAVGAHVAAIALFHVKFEPGDNMSYGAAFYLAIVAASLAFIAGIMKVAAAVGGGTKVDTFDKRGFPPPSTRSVQGRGRPRRR